MKKLGLVTVLIVSTLLFVPMVLVACSSTTSEEPAETQVNNTDPILEIIGLEESKALTMADLHAIEPTAGWGGTISSAGIISPPEPLKGVTVMALAEIMGGLEPGMGVNIVAKDGYGMTMSYEQIAEGDFITYDPGTGEENAVEGPLQVIVAYERDGEPISAEDDGPLRLFIVSEKNDNIVDGHWSVKWVTQIKLPPSDKIRIRKGKFR